VAGRVLATTLIALVFADVTLIGVALARYPAIWSEGGRSYVLYPTAAFGLYAVAAAVVWPARGPATSAAFGTALWWGAAGGAVSAIHLPLEDVATFSPSFQHEVDIALFLGLFACFVVPAVIVTRQTRSMAAGVLAAVGASLIAMLITVAAGFAFNFASIAHQESVLRGAFTHSGMHDEAAFTFVNSLDAAGTHLLEGPVIAALLGAIAAALTVAIHRSAVGRS
jgi:hypothetical protein